MFTPILRPIQGLLILSLSLLSFGVKSGTELDYLWTEGGRTHSRTLELQEGHLRIRNIRPKAATDLLYDASKARWILVDHDHHRLLLFDAQSLNRLSGEIALLAPLLGGLDGQLGQLSPTQKKIWDGALQGFPLALFQHPNGKQSPPRSKAVTPATWPSGLSCAPKGLAIGSLSIDGCMADLNQPAFDEGDRANLDSLLAQLNELLRTLSLGARGLGMKLPSAEALTFQGIPLSLELSSPDWAATLKLKALRSVAFKPGFLRVPKDYSAQKARLW